MGPSSIEKNGQAAGLCWIRGCKARMEACSIRGYDQLAPGHLPAAWQVRTGAMSCFLATRAVARVFVLNFIPLVSER